MDNLKKIGISALAGSLVAFSANAVELTATGSAKVTYISGDSDEVDGNPFGMNTSIAFSGSGDVNGYETTLTIVQNDANTGISSSVLSVDLGDMGTLAFDHGTGVGGLSTIDDVLPSAYEESWDGITAAATTSSNGRVGMGNSGVFVYTTEYAGTGISAQFGKGQSVNNSDDANGGSSGHGSSWDIAVTNSSLVDGLRVGAGYGSISNQNGSQLTGSSDVNEHYTAFVTYSTGPVSVGYQESMVEDNTVAGTHERATGYGIAVNLMDGLSVSYNDREIEFQNAGAAHVTEDATGIAIAYTMGAAKIAFQQNESDNNDGGTTSDENTEIALSLAF